MENEVPTMAWAASALQNHSVWATRGYRQTQKGGPRDSVELLQKSGLECQWVN